MGADFRGISLNLGRNQFFAIANRYRDGRMTVFELVQNLPTSIDDAIYSSLFGAVAVISGEILVGKSYGPTSNTTAYDGQEQH